MRLSRRGLILGGSAMLAGCASASATPPLTTAQTLTPVAPPQVGLPTIQTTSLTPPPLDPRGHVRKELMERAMTALDTHHRHLPLREHLLQSMDLIASHADRLGCGAALALLRSDAERGYNDARWLRDCQSRERLLAEVVRQASLRFRGQTVH